MADHRITIRDKSGEMFDVMGPARHADTGQELTIYRSLKDARVLALPTAEFRGRFTLEHFRDDRTNGVPVDRHQTFSQKSPANSREGGE